ncbi:Cof-type HAD-IIB family hydrolase [Vagococcus intermedius]|uniref:Cof-type HAD-IIB family hydrolase n=1 Tax=Vagococcus intermedius TaxID=2991418 RepID=A0AAF0CV98_9ENTE|nr:Cof-type HAD-IIB family hydrolase [Vagococcus intermedius]WEG73526.1 Cof-type HAD-IIB family hydrolase [Vagococcus intermedius]WEG75608.1 Cof-type HAD-IIB family hydrolase [Vagococcus intermedius]
MKKKLLAFDIDGTLYDSNKKLLPSSIQAIKELQAAGHFVTLATGRSLMSSQEVISELGVENYILCNGAYAFCQNELTHSFPIDKNELKKVVALANEEQIDILYQTLDNVKQQGPFIHQRNQEKQEGYSEFKASYEFDIEEEDAIYQAIMFCDRQTEQLFEPVLDKLRFTRWNEDGLDVIAATGSKAETLGLIARQQGIAQADIIAFGDGDNDIEMLDYAGLGIAMGNASETVKRVADDVTASHDEDGIALALKKYHLI